MWRIRFKMYVDGKYAGEGLYQKHYKLYTNALKTAKRLYGREIETRGSTITYDYFVEREGD